MRRQALSITWTPGVKPEEAQAMITTVQETMDLLRRSLQKKSDEALYPVLKGNRWVLLKRRSVLTPEEEATLASKSQVNPEAYEAFTKGMFHFYKLTPQDLDIAFYC